MEPNGDGRSSDMMDRGSAELLNGFQKARTSEVWRLVEANPSTGILESPISEKQKGRIASTCIYVVVYRDLSTPFG